MKKLILITTLLTLISASVFGYDYTYYLGMKGGFSNLSTRKGESAKYPFQKTIGGEIGYRFHRNWIFEFGYSNHNLFNDSTNSSFGADETNATEKWEAKRYGVTLKKYLNDPDSRINLLMGLGGGLMNWEIRDPNTDTIFNVQGLHNEMVDFDASELFFSGLIGFDYNLSNRWTISTDFQVDYLTGAGQEFESSIKADRSKLHLSLFVSLKILIGGFKETDWTSDESWRHAQQVVVQKRTRGIDSDGDGVEDSEDMCPETAFGAFVDSKGCSIDSDRDGVPDGLDHCPSTNRKAFGAVDINGCPIDSDFDGIADFEDSCPNNPKGAHVDATGCPIDSDVDGVPDGLDDCPYTLYGVDVDKNGCIDLSMLSKPLVLNIDYVPGSFEVDPNNRERLKSLSRILNFVSDIRIEINGYTDNIGTTVANKKLSEKRGLRVKDYLVSLGISVDRIKVFGKGETNFIADNNKAAGRAKNRRIEIVFYK